MPTTGDLYLNNGADGSKGYCSVFSHEKEKAEAGFYQVFLEDYEVDVQLTVSERSGFHQYTFPQGEGAKVVIDLRHRDQVLSAQIKIVDSLTYKGIATLTLGLPISACIISYDFPNQLKTSFLQRTV